MINHQTIVKKCHQYVSSNISLLLLLQKGLETEILLIMWLWIKCRICQYAKLNVCQWVKKIANSIIWSFFNFYFALTRCWNENKTNIKINTAKVVFLSLCWKSNIPVCSPFTFSRTLWVRHPYNWNTSSQRDHKLLSNYVLLWWEE